MAAALTTDRLLLRRWREEDQEPFRRLNNDPRVMEYLAGPMAPAFSDRLILRIEQHFERYAFGLWATEFRESGALIGFIGLSVPQFEAPFMPAVEIGWRLSADYWGKGLATEGARAAMRYGFETAGLPQIVSFTVPENLRSRHVMEKLGMVRNPKDDFDHPGLPLGHWLRRHVLYRLDRKNWHRQQQA